MANSRQHDLVPSSRPPHLRERQEHTAESDLALSENPPCTPKFKHVEENPNFSIREPVPESSSAFVNPFLPLPETSPLNPISPNFSSKAWLTNLHSFASRDPVRYPPRTASLSFKNLSARGFGSPTDYQKTVGNALWAGVDSLFRWATGTRRDQKIQILREFNGVIASGESLLVLGRPGSGCSTLLKTLSGDTHGFHVSPDSELNYQGIPPSVMHDRFRGEAIYVGETDVHFPQVTVGDTLLFAAHARAPPSDTFPGVTRDAYAQRMRDVTLSVFGLREAIDTKVGNDLLPGCSGGERKRVTIAEGVLSGAGVQCWDNSTRGLDSENAVGFCRWLHSERRSTGGVAGVALYGVGEGGYACFDKATVLYEGRQIFFGRAGEARRFFEEVGFEPLERQTTADFLTGVTHPAERRVKPGFENRTPRTPDEFAEVWKRSPEYAALMGEIDAYNEKYTLNGPSVAEFTAARRVWQDKDQSVKSPYLLSLPHQTALCVHRGFQRLKGDASLAISGTVANGLMALVIGSVFYNLPSTATSFYSRGVLLFFAILMNAFASGLEILILYAQRPIVEKHRRYAFHTPSAEAISSILCSLPEKTLNAIFFNMALYFMTNLRRTPSAFLIFLLFSFSTTLALSMLFRSIAAMSRTLVQALCPSAIVILALMIYTGFVIPPAYMVRWLRWIRYVDPIAYAYESLMVNEFTDRNFPCETYIPGGPGYGNLDPADHVCATVGAVPGSNVVSGAEYIRLNFGYQRGHLWRNLGIIFAFAVFFLGTYLIATETIAAKKSKGEVLLFKRGHLKQQPHRRNPDVETTSAKSSSSSGLGEMAPREEGGKTKKEGGIFQWRDICCDIKVKGGGKRILDRVDGWVRPGTLTALLGPSGAGKTTLLDVLATRSHLGAITGEALVDGHQRDISFQRKTGYVQQADIHLETATVREALRFSAVMRQPARVSRREKLEYVEEVIRILGMEGYADAVVGVPGEGLNIEQRKLLSLATELAAKPSLLLFLDEPTSGLDSQTSWSILTLLTKLADHGHAILCTIHQPSATLFQRFERVLFLGPDGKTAYFGELGPGCETVIRYFERNGASPCPRDGNPAEWLMETIGCAPGSHSEINWPEVWRSSPEYAEMRREYDEMKARLREKTPAVRAVGDKEDYREFAAPFRVQLWECFKRINQQYWRSPSYIYSKTALSVLVSLFLGLSLWKADNTLQGLQNQAFSIFMLLTLSSNFVPQILPNFVLQRSLYEAREYPAKIYSWSVFLLSNILVELPWNTLMSVFVFTAWYYPIGLYRNGESTHSMADRGGTMFALVWMYLMYASTFAHMIQVLFDTAEMAGNIANVLFLFSLIFCGILSPPSHLPGIWKNTTYRLSPFTYLVSAILSTAIAHAPVHCSPIELLHFTPPPNTTCGAYMAAYIRRAGGYVVDPAARDRCGFCIMGETDEWLESVGVRYGDRWRNWGILWGYVVVNVALAMGMYWLLRVPKRKRGKEEEGEEGEGVEMVEIGGEKKGWQDGFVFYRGGKKGIGDG